MLFLAVARDLSARRRSMTVRVGFRRGLTSPPYGRGGAAPSRHATAGQRGARNGVCTAQTAVLHSLAQLAGVAELADAPDSKSGDRKVVRVQVPPSVLESTGSASGQEHRVRRIVALLPVRIAELGKVCLEFVRVLVGHLDADEDSAMVGAVIPVVE